MFTFIRHGQSTFNPITALHKKQYGEGYSSRQEYLQLSLSSQFLDAPLTQLGRSQARQLRDRFKGQHIDLVVVTPLRRALQTCFIAFGDHPDQPKFVVDGAIRGYIKNSCDIGSRIIESKKQFPFDFSSVGDTWYLDHLQEDNRQLIDRLKGTKGEEMREKGIEVSLQYLRDFNARLVCKGGIHAHSESVCGDELRKKCSKVMMSQKEYIWRVYGKGQVVVVGHSENIFTWFNVKLKNTQCLKIPM